MFQATNIMTPDDLNKYMGEIQSFLEAEFNADNPAACVSRAEELAGYMAVTGKMIADSKYHYNQLLGSTILQALKLQSANEMSASTLNNYIKSMCRDYQYLCDVCDRLNASTTHQLDLLRTLISKHKTEFQYGHLQK